ncbi:B12-binding domain-containing radical SAM protein [Candidatus Falkowbacteria bacterium]|nr:B12-binding domain-containing radical SAM protein [Candidatus Falkowbacteria bacterium]
MKILLISPPIWNITGESMSTSPPLGLMYLAAILELKKYEVLVLDADAENLKYTWDDLEARIRKEKPDIVGLTATSLTLPALFRSAEIIKKVDPGIVIVAGGYGPTLEAEKILGEEKNIDIIMDGESEATIVELVKVIENNESLDQVQGILYRERGEVRKTEMREQINDLDSLPMPAYHLLEPHYSTYTGVHGELLKMPNAVMLGSRGCPHRCIFCSNKMIKVRFRSPSNICDELEYLRDKLGFKSAQLYDNEFVGMTANQNQWVGDLCDEIIKRGLDNMEFLVQGRCNKFIDLEILKKMRRAGFKWVWWGVESGSQKVLDAIKKDIKVDDIKRTFKLAKEAGLKSMSFIMVGLPKETREDVAMTAKLLREIKPELVRIHITTPLPGSELYDTWRREGKIEEFDLKKYDTRHFVVHHTDELTSKEIMELYQMLAFRFEHGRLYFIKVFFKSFLSMRGLKKIPGRIKKIFKYSFGWLKLK